MSTNFIIDNLSDSDEIDKYFDHISDISSDEEEEMVVIGTETKTKDDEENEDIIIGIDLGTTNSCVGVWRNKNFEIITDTHGNRTIPSAVAFTNRSKYVGKPAQRQTDLNPENTYYEVKRLIGKKFSDSSVQKDIPFFTYELEPDEDDSILLKSSLSGRKQHYTPEEISALILMELKFMAESYLKKQVTKAIITVPAYFNDSQRQATKDAARVAGLQCIRILNEPTAAALAYGLERMSRNLEDEINVIVVDIGGGTTDCSILNIDNGMFETKASTGNTHLGGADFDNALISFCKNFFKRKYGIKKLEGISLLSLQKLKKECESAKKMLSSTWKTTIAVKDFYDDKNLILTITREQFHTLIKDLLILCLKPVRDCVESAEMQLSDIDEIILVGGCTRMPIIRENLQLMFNGKSLNTNINPDEVVAVGAALQGYLINYPDAFSENFVLLDIIPLSLGVEVIGGVMDILIPRNSVIPIDRKRKYTTDTDNETSINVNVYEGERTMTKDNFMVGSFKLEGIEEAPRGIPRIEITFEVDINGIINVTAEDLDNNQNKHTITISGNKGRLSKDKIEELVREAEDLELEDRVEREKKRLYYETDDLCAAIWHNIHDKKCKLKDKDVKMIEEDVNKIRDWLQDKHFMDRETKEYDKILKRIKKRYATLICRTNKEKDKFSAQKESQGEGTAVYGDDVDVDEEVLKKMQQEYNLALNKVEDEEFGLNEEMDDEERAEIKELRHKLHELCETVFDILGCNTLKIGEKDQEELTNYVDDVMLWMYVEEKITKQEYNKRIEEVNDACNKIVEEYEETHMFEKNEILKHMENPRDRVINLCLAIKTSVDNNFFSSNEDHIQKLYDEVDNILEWAFEKDDATDEEYNSKYNSINDQCNKIYHNVPTINQRVLAEDIRQDDDVIMLDFNKNQGTSLDALRKKMET